MKRLSFAKYQVDRPKATFTVTLVSPVWITLHCDSYTIRGVEYSIHQSFERKAYSGGIDDRWSSNRYGNPKRTDGTYGDPTPAARKELDAEMSAVIDEVWSDDEAQREAFYAYVESEMNKSLDRIENLNKKIYEANARHKAFADLDEAKVCGMQSDRRCEARICVKAIGHRGEHEFIQDLSDLRY